MVPINHNRFDMERAASAAATHAQKNNVFPKSISLISHPGLKSIELAFSVHMWNEIAAQLVGQFLG